MRQSTQVVSGNAREEAVSPRIKGGITATTLTDPSDRLSDLGSPKDGVPPEPVPPASHSLQSASELLERLDRLRSAAGYSRRETERLDPHAGGAE
jgi:hypothetical protein